MNLRETEYTVFDFETTGLYPFAGDRICEIGAIRVGTDGRVRDTFHSLVDPRRPVSSGAFRVNGITDLMVRGQPTIDRVLPGFLSFTDKSVLVAYNAGFDLGFLEYALGNRREVLRSYLVIDALKVARRVFPGMDRYNLGAVSHALGVGTVAGHRAMADALATWKVFEKELEALQSSGIVDVEEIAMPRTEATVSARAREEDKVRMIEDAILARRRLAITYLSMWNNAMTKRTITPRAIERTGDTAYIVAHCHLRNEPRHFRLDCVIDAWNEQT